MIKLYIDNYHVHYLLLTVYIIVCVSTLYIIDCIYRLLYVYICSALRLRRKIKYLSISIYSVKNCKTLDRLINCLFQSHLCTNQITITYKKVHKS